MSHQGPLLDAHGREIVRERVRRAAGFLERYVRDDEVPTTIGIAPSQPRNSGWGEQGGRRERAPILGGEDLA